MSSFHLDLVAPEKVLFSGDVQSVIVPGTEGLFQVLSGHAPMMSALKSGVVVAVAKGETKRIFIRGGFADVSSSALTILAEHATFLSDVNLEELMKQIKNMRDDLAGSQTDTMRNATQEKLDELIALQNALAH